MGTAGVLIAVEEYRADEIEGVRFAANDVQGVSEALAAMGGDAAALCVLRNGEATRAAVESALRATIESLTVDDAFYLYFAGRGFSRGGANFLACHDTQASDLMGTSLGLELVFGLLRQASCRQVIVFLDSCHRGALGEADTDGVVTDRADGELEAFFGGAPDRVCLASSLSGQTSWMSRRNQHGAWALNVIDSLRGDAAAALLGGSSLTSASLQGHLDSAVQKTLQGDFVERRNQDPWACGNVSDEFLLAEFAGALAVEKSASKPRVAQVPRLQLCAEARQPIKSLSGFEKHQRVPTEVGRYADGIIREASFRELNDDLEGVYRRLREAFDLRRRDLEKVGPEEGGGSIACPYFTYHVYVAQDPGEPRSVVFRREITDIHDPESLVDSAFGRVFGGVFGSLRLTPPVQIDLDEFIDRMESLGGDLQSLDFDPGGSHCDLRLRGVDARIRVTATEIQLVHDRSKEPSVLLETFVSSQRFLEETQDARLIF